MPLRVVTEFPRVLYHVLSTDPYQEASFTLPPGEYLFLSIPNPMPRHRGNWAVLSPDDLVKLDLDQEAIVGMGYEALMFYGLRRGLFGDLADMYMDIEEIPEAVVAKVTAVANDRPSAARSRIIASFPSHARFMPTSRATRSKPPRLAPIVPLRVPRRRWQNPASARRLEA
ncbi:MAG: hypothetical protein WC465_02595 [Patescibacteria group bacterium]